MLEPATKRVTDSISIDERMSVLEQELDRLRNDVDGLKAADKVSIICFSGDWDRLFAALTIASGAASVGREVHIFFTFWAVSALFKGSSEGMLAERTFTQKMFARMLPAGAGKTKLSKMNYMGLGRRLIKRVMAKEGVDDIDSLLEQVVDLGVNLHLCTTSATLFGLGKEALSHCEKINCCGIATFMGLALQSRVVLFI